MQLRNSHNRVIAMPYHHLRTGRQDDNHKEPAHAQREMSHVPICYTEYRKDTCDI